MRVPYGEGLASSTGPKLCAVGSNVGSEALAGARTLQRRLQEDAVTFHGLVEEARRELSHHYLVESELELTEIGYLLGYEDPNSFIRAFHKWEGTTPGAWRATAPSSTCG